MTLERQYNNFLHENPNSKFSFNEWKEWHGNQIKQQLVSMMRADEELGLYEEVHEDNTEKWRNNPLLIDEMGRYNFPRRRMYSEEEFKELVYHMVGALANANNMTFNGAILDELFNKFKNK
jgi:hypothetical protein